MGISLYQRFNKQEASLFLRCTATHLVGLVKNKKINYILVTKNNPEFFGYQLLEYLLDQTTNHAISNNPVPNNSDRIIRAEEVQSMTGLSRTTIWRMENKQEFPRRVSLGANCVGWRLAEITAWINNR